MSKTLKLQTKAATHGRKKHEIKQVVPVRDGKINLAPIRAMRGALAARRQILRDGHPLYTFLLSKRADVKSSDGFHLRGGESLAAKYPPREPDEVVVSSADGMASSLVNPTVTYEFRLAQSVTIGSNTSGSLAVSLEWDPAVIGGTDWTDISGLFNQVRLVQAKLHLVPVTFNSQSGTTMTTAVCSNITAYSGTPSSITSVVAQPDATMLPTCANAPAPGQVFHFHSPKRPNNLWAAVGAPAPGIDQGCYGTFWLCHDSLTYSTPSARVFSGFIELILEVRGRA